MSSPPKILTGKTVTGPISARMTIDGREYLNFFGAGYLALSGIPEIRAAALRVLAEGAPFAQQLPAAHGAIDPLFEAVERAGAAAIGTPASVYFASGYLIGMVGLASLEPSFDVLVIDEVAHYSLKDAAKLSARSTVSFTHCDPQSLRHVLQRHLTAGQRPLLLTDGVFATTGRIPPLSDYASVLAPYDGRMFIDDSHGFGVVGENGRGAAEHCGVESLATIGATYGKAYCAQGAFVGCSTEMALRLRTLPPMGAAGAGSPISAATATASLAYLALHPEVRTELRAKTHELRTRLRQIGLEVVDSPAPIVSFQCGRRADMEALQRRAFYRGIYLHHSNYIGAGPEGVIRCAVFRDHSRDDIDALITVLR